MAKGRYNKRRSSSGTAKTAAIVFAVIIALSCIVSLLAWGTQGFSDWKFTAWAKRLWQGTQAPDVDDGGLIVDDMDENGISLMSARIAVSDYDEYNISPQTEAAYMLTASTIPANATHTAVNWEISWENASSEWADGKTVTDYVTITPTSDGALTATAACVQAFAEPIRITVRSRADVSKWARTTANYRQKYLYTSVNTQFNDSSHTQNPIYQTANPHTNDGEPVRVMFPKNLIRSVSSGISGILSNPFMYNVYFSKTYTKGIEDETISASYYVKINPELESALRASSNAKFQTCSYATDWTLLDTLDTAEITFEREYDDYTYYTVTASKRFTVLSYLRAMCSGYISLYAADHDTTAYLNEADSAVSDFIEVARQFLDSYHFEVKVVTEYGGVEYETLTKFVFNEQFLQMPITSVIVDKNEIEF